jgi:hypothetical protein
MSTPVPADQEVRGWPATVRPYLLGGLAALSVGAAAIHFAVVFEHFAEYTLYGVFFLVISWAQLIWPAVLLWRPSRLWLSLGIAGNAIIIVVYAAWVWLFWSEGQAASSASVLKRLRWLRWCSRAMCQVQ